MKRLSLAAFAAMALVSLSAMAFDHHHQTWKDPMHNVQSPRADDAALEAQIAEKASVAPRVTPADIEAAIRSEHYFTAAQGASDPCAYNVCKPAPVFATDSLALLTFCVLVLENGFTVTGESACASPDNFNEEIGRKVARANAVNKIWPLLGFRLRDQLHAAA